MEFRSTSRAGIARFVLSSTQLSGLQTSSAHANGPVILVVDDEPSAQIRLELALSHADFAKESPPQIQQALTLSKAREILSQTQVHVVLLDKCLGPEPVCVEMNGIEAIPEMLQLQPHLQIIVATSSHEIQDAVRAIQLGAVQYFVKDNPDEILVSQVERAIDFAMMKLDRTRRERNQAPAEHSMGGRSPAFQQLLLKAKILAETSQPILILGETGAGKTELARWIRDRRTELVKAKEIPFIAVNVSTLSEELIENELFGHEKGGFTDAREMKQGLFELANNGILFFDEIGELPYKLQAKLLTVIETGRFMRVGGTKELHVSVKLIFATNRDLGKMVAAGNFRLDLFQRIKGFTIEIPPLWQRKEDIPDIVRVMLPKCCRASNVFVKFEDIPQDFIEYLKDLPAEGNVRSLQHQLESLLVYSPKDTKGRPVLTKWRSFSGLQSASRAGTQPQNQEQERNEFLTYREFISRPRRFIGPDFPGFKTLISDLKASLLQEASDLELNNRDVARVLQLSEGTPSLWRSQGMSSTRLRRPPKRNAANANFLDGAKETNCKELKQ